MSRDEVMGRVEEDVKAFLDHAVHAYEREGSAWRALIEEIMLVEPTFDAGEVAASELCICALSEEWLTFTLLHHFRHHLDTLRAAIEAKPWCVRMREERPDGLTRTSARLLVEVGRLTPDDEARVARLIRSQAEDLRVNLERGVAALLDKRDLPSQVSMRLDAALRAVERLEAAKLARLRASGGA
jgi:hypothetical protein